MNHIDLDRFLTQMSKYVTGNGNIVDRINACLPEIQDVLQEDVLPDDSYTKMKLDSFIRHKKLLDRIIDELTTIMEDIWYHIWTNEKRGVSKAIQVVTVVEDKYSIFDKIASDKARGYYQACYRLATTIGHHNISHANEKPIQKHYKNSIPKHYHSSYPKEKLTTVFEDLKHAGYFAADSDLDTWLYICGNKGDNYEGEFHPLDWLGKQIHLGYVVYVLFVTNDTNIWEILKNCFTVKGQTPNTNSIKTSIKPFLTGISYKTQKERDRINQLLKL